MTKKFPPISFRYPHMIHGADYNPDQWIKMKDTIWLEDMRLAKLAGINAMSVGIFSWSSLEPEEGVYTFEWLDEVMDMLADNEMYAVLATPTGARPAWMSQKYPEVLRVTEDRQRNLFGFRHNHCLTSPVYRQKTAQINKMLADRYREHPSLLIWHISNEYGGECHCERCQERFREWLKERYGSIDALNDAWWTSFWSHTYTDWSQIESPSSRGELCLHAMVIDWKRFTTDQFVDFFQHEIKDIRKITPNTPITTNFMGTYPGINYFELGKYLDRISWDNYPNWTTSEKDIDEACYTAFTHDLMRGTGGQKPFMIMESAPSVQNWKSVCKLHRPGVDYLQSLQGVAHGADTVQYFQFRKSRGSFEKFHGAVVDHEGSESTRVFKEISEVGATLKKLDEIIGCGIDTKVAIIYDWENMWAIGECKGMLQENNKYLETVISHYKVFWEKAIPVDIIDQKCCIDEYRLLVAPMSYMLRDGFADKVDRFVQNGGTLVITYMSGYVNESDLCFLGGFPGPLRHVIGLWCEEIDALFQHERNAIRYLGKSYEVFDLCEIIHTEGKAKTLGWYENDFYENQPAVTCNCYGKGKAYYIGARTANDFLFDFYEDIISNVKEVCSCANFDFPKGVSVMRRTDGENNYVFIMNLQNKPTVININMGGYSLIKNEVLSGIIELPKYGVEVLRINC